MTPQPLAGNSSAWLHSLKCLRFWQPVMVEAQVDQFGKICFTHAHCRVRSAPIDLDGSIRLGNSAASEDDVVDIAGDLPGIFWLQNPGIADPDQLRGVEQIV